MGSRFNRSIDTNGVNYSEISYFLEETPSEATVRRIQPWHGYGVERATA